MIVLGMDTSSVNATVAVMNDKKLIGEYIISNDKTHSQIIMPLLEDLLKKCGISINDIDVFAVSKGPGSFTGLRIGMASVKTLAQMCDKPVIGVSALESLAQNCSLYSGVVCPIIDARHGEVYNALYRDGCPLCEERVININTLLRELDCRQVVFCGDGVCSYADIIRQHDTGTFVIAPQNISMQKASSVCQVAYTRAEKGDFDNLYSLAPVYLRQSQAERELAMKNAK